MKKIWVLFLLICFFGVNRMSAQKEVPPASFELMKDFIKWWGYHTTHIILSADFTALNTAAEKISKGAF